MQTPNFSAASICRSISFNSHLAVVLCCALILMLAGSWGIFQFFQFSQAEKLHTSRLLFSLNSIKYGIESELKIEADFSRISDSNSGITRRLAAIRANERDILSIEIFDITGDIRVSTDNRGLAHAVSSPLLRACLGSGVWHGHGAETHLQCTSLRDGQGQIRGGLLIRYEISDTAGDRYVLATDWVWHLLALILVLLFFGIIAGWRAIRPTEKRLQAAQAALEGRATAQSDKLLGPLSEAIEKMGQIDADLDRMAQEAERIDRLTETSRPS